MQEKDSTDKKDAPVIIERVANGYMVRPDHSPGYAIGMSEIYVFQNFEGLEKWLDNHFTKPA